MEIAVFGLGKMGAQIARRLHVNGFDVHAWNRGEESRNEVAKAGVKTFSSVEETVASMTESPRVFWIMLLQEVTEDFLKNQLGPLLRAGDIVIDGGNSFYKNSMQRARDLEALGVYYFDAGVSGGVWGEKNGFALMVGGPEQQWQRIEPVMKALSSGENYSLLGKNGAGHFAKMIHNGIEYGMMEAIGEGYAILEASEFKYNLSELTRVYQEGTVIRSWLIDLTRNIFDNENIAETSGEINMLGEGEWTVEAGHELGVDVRVLEDSVVVRKESKDPKNQNKFSNKIVALLRKQFGGHGIVMK